MTLMTMRMMATMRFPYCERRAFLKLHIQRRFLMLVIQHLVVLFSVRNRLLLAELVLKPLPEAQASMPVTPPFPRAGPHQDSGR